MRDDPAPVEEVPRRGSATRFGASSASRRRQDGLSDLSVDANAARLSRSISPPARPRCWPRTEYDAGGVMTHPKTHTRGGAVRPRAQEWKLTTRTARPTSPRWPRCATATSRSSAATRRTRPGSSVHDVRRAGLVLPVGPRQEGDDVPVHPPAQARKVQAVEDEADRVQGARRQDHSRLSDAAGGAAPKNLPMVLNVHGGPWGATRGATTARCSGSPIAATPSSRSTSAARPATAKTS